MCVFLCIDKHVTLTLLWVGSFIVDNYKQALGLIATEPAVNARMAALEVANGAVFEEWVKEERTYLKGLTREPLEETEQMAYYQKLVDLNAAE